MLNLNLINDTSETRSLQSMAATKHHTIHKTRYTYHKHIRLKHNIDICYELLLKTETIYSSQLPVSMQPSGQSNFTTSCIVTSHGRFNGICQVAPVCIAPNTCFFRPIRVHNPNGISIGSAIFAQLMAVSSDMHGHLLSPKNCTFTWGI